MHVTPHVRDYMDKKFTTLDPEMNIYDAIQIFLDNGITGAAVIDKKENLVGILSEKDCLHTIVHGAYSSVPGGGKVKDFMTKDVVTIHPDLDVFTVADQFLNCHFRRLLVMEDKKLVGQITRRDLLRIIKKIKQGD
jgi:predicted transcriptional regulator